MNLLLEELQSLQNETVNIVSALNERDYHQQFHIDLSPIGWHLGHCIYTESYWVKEQLLGKPVENESLKSLYVPELSIKKSRGSALPDKDELVEWANVTQAENRSLLKLSITEGTSHHLLKDNYLLYFLIQHYAQHIETMHMVLTEMQIKNALAKASPSKMITAKELEKENVAVREGFYNVGSDESHHYDNERPTQSVKLEQFNIASLPVSNSDYLSFINSNAYSTQDYWSDEAWKWCNDNKITHPRHWCFHDDTWLGTNHAGPYMLDANHPVHGVSHYEAEAYARWAGARLPSEHEWEVACKNNLLNQTGLVWEWSGSTFKPYPGFTAYPYEGYSVPYFDTKHYVLKGGSWYTKEHIKRSSFRNYYTADKRHLFAGIRLAYDL